MSRQSTDNLYIELGYFTPENYYVYGAEARLDAGFYIEPGYIDVDYYADQGALGSLTCELTEVEGQDIFADAQLSATATVNAVVGVIKQQSAALTAEFSITGTISHIEGADLFAFAEAALAAAVQASREYSASVDSIFDIATDYVRVRTASADADAEFTQSAEGARSRDFDSQIEAAVSLDATANANTKEASATLTVNASVTAETTYSVFMTRTRLENAFVLGATVSPFNPGRPLAQTANTLGEFDYSTVIKKFGTHSALIRTDNSVTYTIPNNTSFDNGFLAIEFWIYSNPINVPLFQIKDSSGTSRYIAVTGSATPTSILFGVTSNSYRQAVGGNLVANQWNHVLCLAGTGTNQTVIYINGVRGLTITSHDGIGLNNGSARIGFSDGYNGQGYVDEFRVIKGKNSWPNGWNPNNSTVTVPTEPFINDDRTSLLVHFDATADDDVSVPIPVKALLSVETRLNAVTSQTIGVVASLAASASLNTDAAKLIEASADITASASVTAVAGYALEGAAAIDSALSFEINAGALNPGEMEATAIATLTATGLRVQGLESQISASTEVTASAQRTRTVSATASSAASLSAEGRLSIKGGVAAIASTAAISATVTVILSPVRSLVHFDALVGGVPQDEFANTWVGAVNSVSTGTAFNNAAGFGDNVFYSNNNAVSSPEIETTLLKSSKVDIGTKDFSVDLRLRPGGEFITIGSTTFSIPVFRQYEGLNQFGNPDYSHGLYITRSFGVSPVIYTLFYNVPGDGEGLETDITLTSNFNHVAVSRQVVNGTSVWRLFLDGVLRDTVVRNSIQDLSFETNGVGYLLGGYNTVAGRSWFGGTIDEFRLIIDNNPYTENFAPSTVNYNDFIVLYDNTNISSQFNLTVDYLRVKFGDTNLTATATQSVINGRIRNTGAAQYSVTAAQSTIGRKITTTASNQTVTATMNVTAVKTARVISNQTVTATQTASGQRIRFAELALSASANLALPFGEVLKTPSVFLNSEFSQSTQNDRFRDNVIETESIATQLSAVAKIGDFLINADVVANLSAEAFKQTDVVSNQTVVTTFSADPIKTVFGEAGLSAEFTTVIAADKIKRVEAVFSSDFSVSIPGQKVTDTSASVSAEFETVSTPNRIRDNAVGLNTITTLDVPVTEIVIFFEADLSAETSGIFVITYLVQASADLQVNGFQLSAGRVIHIDEFNTLIVPGERRRIKVQSERRDLLVKQETRILTV
jgi:hypothetical protein